MGERTKKHHIKKPDYFQSNREKVKNDDNSIIWGKEVFKEWFGDLPEGAVALRGYRNREGLTQKEFAELIGINQGTISMLENGKRNIGKKTAIRLGEFFKTDYRMFL